MITLRHLETTVTVACQNRCVGCNAFVPLQVGAFRSAQVTPDALALDLAHVARVAHVARYALIGGEPTTHPHLEALLDVALASGIADQLELWSNGQGLVDRDLPWLSRLDRLVVTAYPNKVTDDELAWLACRCDVYGVVFELHDYRVTPRWLRLLEPPTDEATTQRKYDRCRNRQFNHVLDGGVFYRCCTSPFIPRLIQGRPAGSDGLPVAGLTEAALRAFLDQDEAMESCRVCAHGSRDRGAAWVEVGDPVAWVSASGGASC